MVTAEEKENQQLKLLEKKRVTTFMRTDQDDFKQIAADGERIHLGQTRTNAGSLGIFKNMLDKPAKTQGIMKHILPVEVQGYIQKQICPECQTPLDKSTGSREWHCANCNQTYAVV